MDIGVPELLIVLVIVIVLFGPGRFGKILGELGSGLRSFKDNLDGNPKKNDEPAPAKESAAETANTELSGVPQEKHE
jgi:sec-independent protein translocase protein TatA